MYRRHPVTRGAYKKSEQSRRQVLDAAIVELAKRGYAKTSVSDIATAAKLSKGAVHYHFESKDDLIRQVLADCASTLQQRVQAAWEAPGEPIQRLRRALLELRQLRKQGLPELRVLADLMAQALGDPSLVPPLKAMFEATRVEALAQIERAVSELGLVPRVPLEVVPRLLLATIDGLALHDHFDPPSEATEDALQGALERIAVGLFDAPHLVITQ